MKGEFYKMEFDAWDEGTVDLSLELEAAYLRICHQMYRRRGAIPNSEKLLCALWRCHTNRARVLLSKLIEAGKISLDADGYLTNNRVGNEVDQRETISSRRGVTGQLGGTQSGVSRRKSLKNNDQIEAFASTDRSREEEIREEKKPPLSPPGGEGGKSRSNKGARIDPDWQPSESLVAFARSLGFAQDAWKSVRDEFVDYRRGVAGPKALKLDWDATFRNWLRTTAERRGVRPAAPTDGARADGWPTRIQQDPDGVYRLWKKGIWPPSLGPPVGDPNCWIPKQFVDEWQERARQDLSDVSNSRH